MGKLLTPDAYIESIYSITADMLKAKGIKGLVLDIDNTLVATHEKDAGRHVIEYIHGLNQRGIKTVIVSNAHRERVEKFCRPLGIKFIYKAHKPFRGGLHQAVKLMDLPAQNLAMVGDQLFTDVLGGNLYGMKTILIKPIDPSEPWPIRAKRLFERPFISNKRYESNLK